MLEINMDMDMDINGWMVWKIRFKSISLIRLVPDSLANGWNGLQVKLWSGSCSVIIMSNVRFICESLLHAHTGNVFLADL